MAVVTERMLESSCAPVTRIVAQTHPGKASCKVRRMMLRLAAGRDMLCRIGERLVSKGLSPSALGLAACRRQLPCGDDFRKYVVRWTAVPQPTVSPRTKQCQMSDRKL
jgi:hypothetical protein